MVSRKRTGETSRGKAERWAIDYLTAGQIVKKENVTLQEYSKDFFSWEGSWATDKRVRGLRISRRQCHNLTYQLESHIVPHMGAMKLTSITRATIKDYRNNLHNKGYAGNTINKALSALRAILEAAEEEALIQFVPKIDRAAIDPKHKGILTIEEVRKLFSIDWKTEPTHCHPEKFQFMGYAGNILASSTGLRMGKMLALVISDMHLENGYIHVRRSWDKLFGLNQTTKTGRARNIFIPDTVRHVLYRFIETSPYPNNPESFIFYSLKTPEKPACP
ncbi:MAG TPA: tyrosine-type recombinase/integrase [Spirochaetota bacterium]|nr:tyrosine-type recombinase/integrase [Spirochaetota bacterium]HPV43673.1 tyrosine-type recombinase/integrase [Spirochaetota bacterium]